MAAHPSARGAATARRRRRRFGLDRAVRDRGVAPGHSLLVVLMPVDAGTRFDTNFFDREIGLSTFMELSHGRFPVRRRQAGSQRFSVDFLVPADRATGASSWLNAWETRFF